MGTGRGERGPAALLLPAGTAGRRVRALVERVVPTVLAESLTLQLATCAAATSTATVRIQLVPRQATFAL